MESIMVSAAQPKSILRLPSGTASVLHASYVFPCFTAVVDAVWDSLKQLGLQLARKVEGGSCRHGSVQAHVVRLDEDVSLATSSLDMEVIIAYSYSPCTCADASGVKCAIAVPREHLNQLQVQQLALLSALCEEVVLQVMFFPSASLSRSPYVNVRRDGCQRVVYICWLAGDCTTCHCYLDELRSTVAALSSKPVEVEEVATHSLRLCCRVKGLFYNLPVRRAPYGPTRGERSWMERDTGGEASSRLRSAALVRTRRDEQQQVLVAALRQGMEVLIAPHLVCRNLPPQVSFVPAIFVLRLHCPRPRITETQSRSRVPLLANTLQYQPGPNWYEAHGELRGLRAGVVAVSDTMYSSTPSQARSPLPQPNIVRHRTRSEQVAETLLRTLLPGLFATDEALCESGALHEVAGDDSKRLIAFFWNEGALRHCKGVAMGHGVRGWHRKGKISGEMHRVYGAVPPLIFSRRRERAYTAEDISHPYIRGRTSGACSYLWDNEGGDLCYALPPDHNAYHIIRQHASVVPFALFVHPACLPDGPRSPCFTQFAQLYAKAVLLHVHQRTTENAQQTNSRHFSPLGVKLCHRGGGVTHELERKRPREVSEAREEVGEAHRARPRGDASPTENQPYTLSGDVCEPQNAVPLDGQGASTAILLSSSPCSPSTPRQGSTSASKEVAVGGLRYRSLVQQVTKAVRSPLAARVGRYVAPTWLDPSVGVPSATIRFVPLPGAARTPVLNVPTRPVITHTGCLSEDCRALRRALGCAGEPAHHTPCPFARPRAWQPVETGCACPLNHTTCTVLQWQAKFIVALQRHLMMGTDRGSTDTELAFQRSLSILWHQGGRRPNDGFIDKEAQSTVSRPSCRMLETLRQHRWWVMDQHAVHERLRLEYFIAFAEAYVHHPELPMPSTTCNTDELLQRRGSIAKLLTCLSRGGTELSVKDGGGFPVVLPGDLVGPVTALIDALHRWGWRFARAYGASGSCVAVLHWPLILLEGFQLHLSSMSDLRMMVTEMNAIGMPSLIAKSSTPTPATVIPSALLRFFIMRSCRGAVMFGDRLPIAAIQNMVAAMPSVTQYYFCSHGRPSMAALDLLTQSAP